MAKEPPDPRYRPFRIAMWVIYFVLTIFFCMSIIVSVIRSTLSMTPDHLPPAGTALSTDECLATAKALWTELDEQRKGLSGQPEVRRVDADYWTQFRVGWLNRHRAAESACAVTAPGREKLRTVFDKLEKTMDLYTTSAVQFAGEVGPTVDGLKTSFADAAPSK